MPFEPQNALERSLIQAASDPAHRPQLYKDLAQSDLFIIQEGPLSERSGRTVLKENQTIQVRHMDWNGKTCIPVFSSLPRLQAVLQEADHQISVEIIGIPSGK
jgi:hypothetical protein